MADSKTPLEPEGIYHIYNHSVGSELLFYYSSNYLYFLKLFDKYLANYVNVFAYCLMPNHFHFVLQIKSEEEINLISTSRISITHNNKGTPEILSTRFSHFFNAYAQAINKQQNRKGSLFNNRFKRKPVNDELYLQKLIHYIHFNPLEAGLCKDISDWPYSSYGTILSENNTLIERSRVIQLFDNIENFVFFHKLEPSLSDFDN